jgi:hypothetical protein
MVIYVAIAVIIVIAAILIYKRKKREKDMQAVFQVFDADGDLIFDLANKTSYVLGTGNTGTQNGSLNNSKITERTWVVVLSCPTDGQVPYFSATKGKLSWQFLGGDHSPSPKNVTFMYGAY